MPIWKARTISANNEIFFCDIVCLGTGFFLLAILKGFGVIIDVKFLDMFELVLQSMFSLYVSIDPQKD